MDKETLQISLGGSAKKSYVDDDGVIVITEFDLTSVQIINDAVSYIDLIIITYI